MGLYSVHRSGHALVQTSSSHRSLPLVTYGTQIPNPLFPITACVCTHAWAVEPVLNCRGTWFAQCVASSIFRHCHPVGDGSGAHQHFQHYSRGASDVVHRFEAGAWYWTTHLISAMTPSFTGLQLFVSIHGQSCDQILHCIRLWGYHITSHKSAGNKPASGSDGSNDCGLIRAAIQ